MISRRPLLVLLLLGLARISCCDERRRLRQRVSGELKEEGGRRRELEPEQQQQASAGGCRLTPFEDAGEGWQLKAADILNPGESGQDAFGPDFAWGAGACGACVRRFRCF